MDKSFLQNFFRCWYNISDDLKQVIVFPMMVPKPNTRIERIPGKIRQKSSLDQLSERLQNTERCDILLSPKKILKLTGTNSLEDKSVQKFMDMWLTNFNGCNLSVTCKIVYWPDKNKKHTKDQNYNPKIRKIEGYIERF